VFVSELPLPDNYRAKGGVEMNKVKLFDCGSVSKLEHQVNEFLSAEGSESSFELIDIKFTSYSYGEDRTDYHAAMIIYKI
jgi:hypothetical protein